MRQLNSGLNQRSHFYLDNKKSKLSFGRKTSVLSQKKNVLTLKQAQNLIEWRYYSLLPFYPL